jgi:hypothetical protein
MMLGKDNNVSGWLGPLGRAFFLFNTLLDRTVFYDPGRNSSVGRRPSEI